MNTNIASYLVGNALPPGDIRGIEQRGMISLGGNNTLPQTEPHTELRRVGVSHYQKFMRLFKAYQEGQKTPRLKRRTRRRNTLNQ